ncbi:MAG: hypothetical protein A2085_06335 [Gemmatimonadetes bacterium GWC2_71_10]|nr:MAG: hypothetical protein A2085_06335 [Gemmatimonadetes bacterium GWC2_71_10]
MADPWRAMVGPGGAVWRRIRAYEQHADPDFAAIAAAADTALTRVKQLGWRRRLRWMFRGQ